MEHFSRQKFSLCNDSRAGRDTSHGSMERSISSSPRLATLTKTLSDLGEHRKNTNHQKQSKTLNIEKSKTRSRCPTAVDVDGRPFQVFDQQGLVPPGQERLGDSSRVWYREMLERSGQFLVADAGAGYPIAAIE